MTMSGMRDDIETVLLTEEQLRTRTAELGAMISKDFAGREPLFVGVLKGCFVFMADLMRFVTIHAPWTSWLSRLTEARRPRPAP